MPVFAVDILDVGASGLGLLYSVSGVGALLGIFVVGSLGSIQRKGLLPIGGATLYGGFLTLFAVSTWFPLSLAALFLLGLFSSIYMISVQTTLQVMVPDVLRGRVMGIYGMSWSVGPLGALQAGAIARPSGRAGLSLDQRHLGGGIRADRRFFQRESAAWSLSLPETAKAPSLG